MTWTPPLLTSHLVFLSLVLDRRSCERLNVDTLALLRFYHASPYRASVGPAYTRVSSPSASRMPRNAVNTFPKERPCRDCQGDVRVGHQTRWLPERGTKYRHACTSHARTNTHTDITHTYTRAHTHVHTPTSTHTHAPQHCDTCPVF